MLERLVTTLDRANDAGLCVMPTLFTGHMSGVNWIPEWALGGDAGDARFRVVSKHRVVQRAFAIGSRIHSSARRNLLATELARALEHRPFWLGPRERKLQLRDPPTCPWPVAPVHDQRDSRRGRPRTRHRSPWRTSSRSGRAAEAAEACDFLTMHGYRLRRLVAGDGRLCCRS
jgi:hypothetical protein